MDDDELQRVLAPHLFAAAEDVRNGKRLVHYTTAEAAYRIITGRQVWLRSVHLMNDYLEVRHGLACLRKAWNSDAGTRLQQWLKESWEALNTELEKLFDGHSSGILDHTYILSLSEHGDDEDEFGRLSMWRAYGGRNGVALVLNTGAFLSDTDSLAVFSTPVLYQNEDDYVAWFTEWVDNIIAHSDVLNTLDRQVILNFIFHVFRITLLATKHPGFREEQEWRIFHSPLIDGSSDWVALETEVINGVPQPVIKLQLRDDKAANVVGVAPEGLVNRVIIGPCEDPLPIRNAIWSALDQAGVPDVANKIWMSFIPLRQR